MKSSLAPMPAPAFAAPSRALGAPPPILETERLILREMTAVDAEALFQVYCDPQWLRFWGFAADRNVLDTRTRIAHDRLANRRRVRLRWAITRRDDGQPIGSAGYYRFMPEHRRAEITYELCHSASGRGYMTEAVRAIVRFGFEHLGLHSIEAGIDPRNHASMAVVERVGFRREGYLRQNYLFAGEFCDTILYTMLDDASTLSGASPYTSSSRSQDARAKEDTRSEAFDYA